MGSLAACTVLATMPFFLAQQYRPGQQVPDGTPMWKAGMKFVSFFNLHNMLTIRQVYSAARSVRYLKQCGLYLVAYFMLQESEFSHTLDSMGLTISLRNLLQCCRILQNE